MYVLVFSYLPVIETAKELLRKSYNFVVFSITKNEPFVLFLRKGTNELQSLLKPWDYINQHFSLKKESTFTYYPFCREDLMSHCCGILNVLFNPALVKTLEWDWHKGFYLSAHHTGLRGSN